MKIRKSLIVSLLFAAFFILTQTLDKVPDITASDQASPLIIEYIPQFKVSVNDLKNAINGQFKSINTSAIKTSYASIDQAFCQLTYKNHSNTSFLTPLKVRVSNDSFGINCTFKVTVAHIANTKKYNCYALTNDIMVNYTKEVNFASGNTTISDFTSSYSPSSFKSAVCAQKQSAKDKVRIDEAVTNSQSQSIYKEVKKTLDKMKAAFQDNVQAEHLSQIYPDNPYVYTYYGFNISVNVSTLQAQKFGDTGLLNMIRGTTPGASHFPSSTPPFDNEYNLFFSKQYIQNILDYSVANYNSWKAIISNRTNMRTDTFRFRLVDYEYITPGILKNYPSKYLADTQVSCKIKSYKNFQMVSGVGLNLQMRWECQASVQVAPGSRYKFINFQAQLFYEVTIDMRSKDYLTLYSKPTKLIDLSFNLIDEQIQEPYIIKYTIEQSLFEFWTYPIGNFMKVKPGSSKIKIADQGLWIG